MSQLFDRQAFPDRPWSGRGYGRIRLDESLTRDLWGIMHDVIKQRLEEVHEAKRTDGNVVAAKQSLKRANAINDRVKNLMREQGWEDAEAETYP